MSALVHLLFALGFRGIQTRAPGQPSLAPLVDGAEHHPDVTARSGRTTLDVFVVETQASLSSEATRRRLHALDRAAKATGTGLWLAVPPEARGEASHHLQKLGVQARVICV